MAVYIATYHLITKSSLGNLPVTRSLAGQCSVMACLFSLGFKLSQKKKNHNFPIRLTSKYKCLRVHVVMFMFSNFLYSSLNILIELVDFSKFCGVLGVTLYARVLKCNL